MYGRSGRRYDRVRTLTELPALSPDSLHFTVDGATHESLVAKREHALVVVDAICRMSGRHAPGSTLAELMEMP